MHHKVYSKITEFASNEFSHGSLIPSALLKRSYEAIDLNMTHFYWNMLHRIKDKKVTFEQLQIYVSLFNRKIYFPEDSRLLIQTHIPITHNSTQLQYEADIFNSVYPFGKVACYRALAREFTYPDPENALFAQPSKEGCLSSEIAEYAHETEADKNFMPVSRFLTNLRKKGDWIGPVETEHIAIEDYCQYAQLAIFMNYIGPVLSIGKRALFQYLRTHNGIAYPKKLASKLDFTNWQCWIYLIKTFYLNDRFYVKSYYMNDESDHYIRHELYTRQPEMIANIIIEKYTLF